MDNQKIRLEEALTRMVGVARLVNRMPRTYGCGIVLYPTEIHMIEAIENHPDSNTTSLAVLFGITKGSVSKMLAKLHCKGFVERYQVPTNKKEIYFRLTELGKKAFEGHKCYHSRHNNKFFDDFSTYTVEQQNMIIDFVDNYTANIKGMVEEAEDGDELYADMDV